MTRELAVTYGIGVIGARYIYSLMKIIFYILLPDESSKTSLRSSLSIIDRIRGLQQ